MNDRAILKKLKLLEKQFYTNGEQRKLAFEINELLRQHEELMDKLREEPNYVVLERQMIKSMIQKLQSEGLI